MNKKFVNTWNLKHSTQMMVINPHLYPMPESSFSAFILYPPSFLLYCTNASALALIGLISKQFLHLQPASCLVFLIYSALNINVEPKNKLPEQLVEMFALNK